MTQLKIDDWKDPRLAHLVSKVKTKTAKNEQFSSQLLTQVLSMKAKIERYEREDVELNDEENLQVTTIVLK